MPGFLKECVVMLVWALAWFTGLLASLWIRRGRAEQDISWNGRWFFWTVFLTIAVGGLAATVCVRLLGRPDRTALSYVWVTIIYALDYPVWGRLGSGADDEPRLGSLPWAKRVMIPWTLAALAGGVLLRALQRVWS